MRIAASVVRLLSAADIAAALNAGEAHLGVTGEDLLREQGEGLDERVLLLRALGFGRADLVVATPKSWLDVEAMADLEEVAHEIGHNEFRALLKSYVAAHRYGVTSESDFIAALRAAAPPGFSVDAWATRARLRLG